MKTRILFVVVAACALLVANNSYAVTKCTAQKAKVTDTKTVRKQKTTELRVANNQLKKATRQLTRKESICTGAIGRLQARADSKSVQLNDCSLTVSILDKVFDDPTVTAASCMTNGFLGDVFGSVLSGFLCGASDSGGILGVITGVLAGTSCSATEKAAQRKQMKCQAKSQRICSQLVSLRTLKEEKKKQCDGDIANISNDISRQTANVAKAQEALTTAEAAVEDAQAKYATCMNGA